MFVPVVSPGFSLVQTMMTTDYDTVTNPLVEASLRDGLISYLVMFYCSTLEYDVIAIWKFDPVCHTFRA